MRIAVVGLGYVGLVTGLVLAETGHDVAGVEKGKDRLGKLRRGETPFHEPHLAAFLERHGEGMTFSSDLGKCVERAEAVVIAVGTPSLPGGGADLGQVREVARQLARSRLPESTVVVNKSTVPIGTGGWVAREMGSHMGENKHTPSVASCPEFLREGTAFHDALYPDRIVVGADKIEAIRVVRRMFRPIARQSFSPPPGLPRPRGWEKGVPVLETGLESAELIKYASNAFLATKVSFVNEVANICDLVGADIEEVTQGMGMDDRIGPRFLRAGLGWGGSCFGKDVSALCHQAAERGYRASLLQAAISVNEFQRELAVRILAEGLGGIRGKRIALFGLSFKPGTSDLRDAPALTVARILVDRGANLVGTDPVAIPYAKRRGITFQLKEDPYEAARGADAVLLATEWPVYLGLDWMEVLKRMRGNLIVDGRNALGAKKMEGLGFLYKGIGTS